MAKDWKKSGSQGRNDNPRNDNKPNNGCKSGHAVTKEGEERFWISGWNVSKDKGMVSVLIGEYEKTQTYTSSKEYGSKRHTTLVAVVKYHNSGVKSVEACTYCHETGYVTLKDAGWVLNPKKGHMTRFNPNWNK